LIHLLGFILCQTTWKKRKQWINSLTIRRWWWWWWSTGGLPICTSALIRQTLNEADLKL
jgi:hypothetical protein